MTATRIHVFLNLGRWDMVSNGRDILCTTIIIIIFYCMYHESKTLQYIRMVRSIFLFYRNLLQDDVLRALIIDEINHETPCAR